MTEGLIELMMFTPQEGMDLLDREHKTLRDRLEAEVVKGFAGVIGMIKDGGSTLCPVCDGVIDRTGNLGYACAVFDKPDLDADEGEMIVHYCGVCRGCADEVSSPEDRKALEGKVIDHYTRSLNMAAVRSSGTETMQ
jgi:hypothetical protein